MDDIEETEWPALGTYVCAQRGSTQITLRDHLEVLTTYADQLFAANATTAAERLDPGELDMVPEDLEEENSPPSVVYYLPNGWLIRILPDISFECQEWHWEEEEEDEEPSPMVLLKSQGRAGNFEHIIGKRISLDEHTSSEEQELVGRLVNSAFDLLSHHAKSSSALEDQLAVSDRTIDIVLFVQSNRRGETVTLRVGGTQPLPTP